jgi:hypothetical protein
MVSNKIVIRGKEIDLIKELGIDQAPAAVQEKILGRMANLVLRRSALKAMGSLSEEEVKLINEDLKSENIEDVIKMLDRKIPNFDKILSEQISLLQEEVLS